jgi:endonuclease/exonuclease/phosphatase family metal-dependent hydrolase
MTLRGAMALALCLMAPAVRGDTIRVASFNAELVRAGPGLLLRDIAGGDDPQIAAFVAVVAEVAPDILVLQGVDFDHRLASLGALNAALAAAGAGYADILALPTNRGLDSGRDLDGDGQAGGPGDAQGYGRFYGQGAMAILSRFPIRRAGLRDFTPLRWADLPGALRPETAEGAPFPTPQAWEIRRLSSSGHWVVPVDTPSGILTILAFHAGPPVFDGPEDANGRRNHDEIVFWQRLLDADLGAPPDPPFVLAGSANLDPDRGEGRRAAIRALLDDPRLQDPAPTGASGPDTVDWPQVGRLRVDYVLPSADLAVTGGAVHWPAEGAGGHNAAITASRHRLVWVDVTLPPG